ncbi:hypothetical protein J1614_006178 [Plenodomus biglobosus]|nr:hypothetical protein J1614_006178 [Plenodomus biglobosus]
MMLMLPPLFGAFAAPGYDIMVDTPPGHITGAVLDVNACEWTMGKFHVRVVYAEDRICDGMIDGR